MIKTTHTNLPVLKSDTGVFRSLLSPSSPQVTLSVQADSVIWLKAGHMALYLVRRSLCVAAHSFQPASKPLRNAELSDSD